MSNNRILRAITQWLKKQIIIAHKQGRCTKVILHHIGTSGKLGSEVCVVNVGEFKEPGSDITDDDIDQYASDFETEASSYAEGLGTTQTFALAAYFEEDESRPLARHAFRVSVEGTGEEEDISSEPANLAGVTKMLMRHAEAKERTTTAMLGSVLHTLQKQNEQLSGMVTTMMEDRVEQMEAFESLISAKHSRDLEIEERKTSAMHKGQLLDNVLALLPVAVNKVMGRKVVAETVDPVQLQLMKLVEALNEKDVAGLIEALPEPEKKIAFIEALQMIKSAVDEREAKRIAALEASNGVKAS